MFCRKTYAILFCDNILFYSFVILFFTQFLIDFDAFRAAILPHIFFHSFLPSSFSSLAFSVFLLVLFLFALQHFALASVSRKWRHRMHIVVVQSRLRGTYFQPLSWVVWVGDSQSFSLRDDVIAEITGKFSSSDDKRKVLRFAGRLSRLS